jgi:hypothetical protein
MTSMLIRSLMNMTRISVLRLWRVEKCSVLARTIVELEVQLIKTTDELKEVLVFTR